MRRSPLRWAGFGIAAVAVVFAVVLASRFGADPGLVDSPLLGKEAPGFSLQLIEGEGNVSLDQLTGQIVVVNFFASWCLQCRNEQADLVATADAFADQGVTFVQISYQEDPAATREYLTETGTSPAITYLIDEASRTAIAYGVFGIPETFFIDQGGIIVGKVVGEVDALTLGATIDAIRRGERPGQTVTGSTQQQPG